MAMSDKLDDVTIQEALNDDGPPDDFDSDDFTGVIEGMETDEQVTEAPEPTPAASRSPNSFPKDLAALLERHRREQAAITERTIRQTLKPQPRQPGEGEPPPMPVLPDGLGMNLEQVQNLLAEKHKTIVSLDDPVLMMVSIMNAFLAQEGSLLERHKTATAKIMTDKTGEYVGAVKHVTDSLSASLSDVTLAAMQKTFADHRLELEKHKRNIMWLSAIVAISALINVIIFIVR
jgi:hypothetical protein